MKRILCGIFLALCLATTGFGLGGLLAAAHWVPPGAGLAAGATVAVAGLCGAVLGAVGGILLALRLGERALLPAALASVLLAAGVIGAMLLRAALRHPG